MIMLLHRALLRLFGIGSATANMPPSPPKIELSPVMQQLRDNARADASRPAPGAMTVAQAADVFARHAGQRPANEAAPPEWRVKLALGALPPLVLLYFRVLETLGRAFPRAGKDNDAEFERRLTLLALTDVKTWVAGIFSCKRVTVPAHITAVLIQRAAKMLGQTHPVAIVDDEEPDFFFFVEAELQMCIIDLDTRYCVFPQVIARGETDPIEIPGTDRRFHRDTVTASNWAFRLGFAGQVFEPPVVPDDVPDADAAAADLTPKGTKQ